MQPYLKTFDITDIALRSCGDKACTEFAPKR